MSSLNSPVFVCKSQRKLFNVPQSVATVREYGAYGVSYAITMGVDIDKKFRQRFNLLIIKDIHVMTFGVNITKSYLYLLMALKNYLSDDLASNIPAVI